MRKVITIAREFGAGGGEIGRKVAKELGIQFYDKDIILRTALANPKLDPEDVRRWDERVPSSFGFAQSLFDFYNKPLDERLWQAQRDAIREMANHESCVIVEETVSTYCMSSIIVFMYSPMQDSSGE